jgi:cell division septation protein DedD
MLVVSALSFERPAEGIHAPGGGSCDVAGVANDQLTEEECLAQGGTWTAATTTTVSLTTTTVAATTTSAAATTTTAPATTTTVPATTTSPPTTSGVAAAQLAVAEQTRDVLTLGLGFLVFCGFAGVALWAGRG